ncbi:hypothetical protein M3Y99_01492500 [Aphelenchoides fujianensis]|nr:hypothetical protein M3Y99_01492500 [Aphelenchoides fujianensis]
MTNRKQKSGGQPQKKKRANQIVIEPAHLVPTREVERNYAARNRRIRQRWLDKKAETAFEKCVIITLIAVSGFSMVFGFNESVERLFYNHL